MFPSNLKQNSLDPFKKPKRQINPKDYCPRRFALNYQPPMLILEYFIPSSRKLYHKWIKIKEWHEHTSVEDVTRVIYKKYQNYLPPGKIKPQQIKRLLEKLKNECLSKKAPKQRDFPLKDNKENLVNKSESKRSLPLLVSLPLHSQETRKEEKPQKEKEASFSEEFEEFEEFSEEGEVKEEEEEQEEMDEIKDEDLESEKPP